MSKLYTITQRLAFCVAFAFPVACGQMPTKQEEAAEKAKETTTEPGKTVAESGEKGPSEGGSITPSVKPPKALTKEQQLQVFTRLAFDSNFKKGNMFTVEGLYYILKGGTGTMGFPDVQVVGNAKDARVSCPIGFSVIGRMELSIAKAKGLLDVLPSGKKWVWTGDKATESGTGYYAIMAAEDMTREDGSLFYEGFFYTARGSQIDGQIYCAMSVHDLPKIEEMPDYMQDVLSSIAADPNE